MTEYKFLKVYVDGGVLGRNPSPRGVYWSMRVEGDEDVTRKEDRNYHTNNDAEWLALREGLRWAVDHQVTRPIVIYSDSRHVVDCFNEKKRIKIERHLRLFYECKRLAGQLKFVGVKQPERPRDKPRWWPLGRKWPEDWRPRDEIVQQLGH